MLSTLNSRAGGCLPHGTPRQGAPRAPHTLHLSAAAPIRSAVDIELRRALHTAPLTPQLQETPP